MVTFAIDPRKSAVVAIDLQNCNVEKSPIAAPLGLQVVDKLNLLAAHYRAAGSTIIWTRHAVRPDHSDVGILGKTVPPVAQGVIDDGAPSAALPRTRATA
jgi:biuret amidohydrolase